MAVATLSQRLSNPSRDAPGAASLVCACALWSAPSYTGAGASYVLPNEGESVAIKGAFEPKTQTTIATRNLENLSASSRRLENTLRAASHKRDPERRGFEPAQLIRTHVNSPSHHQTLN